MDIPKIRTTKNYAMQEYPVYCHGRNPEGNIVLGDPIFVMVKIRKDAGCNSITSSVECPCLDDSNDWICRASGERVNCVYRFDIP